MFDDFEEYLNKRVKIITIDDKQFVGNVYGYVPAPDNEPEIDQIDILNEKDNRLYGLLKTEIKSIEILEINKNEKKFIKCACCGSLEVPVGDDGHFYICNNCGWEKDEIQENKSNYKGGANKMSLNEAKKAYKEHKKIY